MDLLLTGFPFKGWDGYITLPESWHTTADVLLSWANGHHIKVQKREDIEPINWQRDGYIYDIRPVTTDGTIWIPQIPWRSYFAGNATIVIALRDQPVAPYLIVREAFHHEKTAIYR